MTRTQIIAAGAVAGVLGLAGLYLYVVTKRAEGERVTPAWLDPQQPPAGVAAPLTALSPEQSWAANRARPMAACCTGRTAGTRIRRTYADTLATDRASLVRASIGVEVDC